MRLIDADELIKMLANHKKTQAHGHFGPYMEGIYCGFNKSLSDIESAPTIDAEIVRHGEWVLMNGFPACKNCGASPAYFDPSPDNPSGYPTYCFNCGAKMDLEA